MPLGAQSEPSFEQSLGTSALEKVAIAKAAAELVASGESIVIDAGTTTAFLARELVARRELTDLVVFTNSFSAAHELEPAIPRFSVVLSGGTLRPLQHSLVDPMGGRILEHIHADTAFLSCSGIHPETGVTNINIAEAEMKIRMLRAHEPPHRPRRQHEAGAHGPGSGLRPRRGRSADHRRGRGCGGGGELAGTGTRGGGCGVGRPTLIPGRTTP